MSNTAGRYANKNISEENTIPQKNSLSSFYYTVFAAESQEIHQENIKTGDLWSPLPVELERIEIRLFSGDS